MAREWFGFRVVTRVPKGKPGVWHGFRTNVPGSPSLCGRVTFGPEYRSKGGRSCAVCGGIWAKRYPAKADA